MPQIILSTPILLWYIATCVSTICFALAFITPYWLKSNDFSPSSPLRQLQQLCPQDVYLLVKPGSELLESPRPPLCGFVYCIEQVCSQTGGIRSVYRMLWSQPFSELEISERVMLMAFLFGAVALGMSFCAVCFTFCVREIKQRSLLLASGVLQASADAALVLSIIIWPVTWNSRQIRNVCGGRISPYSLNGCVLDWGFFVCLGGIFTLLLSAYLSILAERSLHHPEAQRFQLSEETFLFI